MLNDAIAVPTLLLHIATQSFLIPLNVHIRMDASTLSGRADTVGQGQKKALRSTEGRTLCPLRTSSFPQGTFRVEVAG